MCGLIWLPRPSDEAALRRAAAGRWRSTPWSSACGRRRWRRRSQLQPLGARAASINGKNGSWLVSASGAAVVAERPRAPAPAASISSNDPPSIPSIFMCAPSRRRHAIRGPRSVTPPRYRPSRELCTPLVAVAELLLVVQGVPARVPVLLPRAAPGAARRTWTTKGTLVHRALELLLDRPADERTLDAALADLGQRPGRARDPPRLHRPRAHRRGVGAVRRRRRVARAQVLRARRPAHRATPSGWSSSSRPTSAASGCAGIIDRLELDENGELVVTDYKTGSVPSRVLGGEEPRRRPHVRAAVRAHARHAARPACSSSTCRSPRRSSPRPPSSRSWASSARPSRCGRRHRQRVRARRLPATPRAPVRLLHVQALLPGARRRPPRRRGAARPRHHDRAAAPARLLAPQPTARRRQLLRRPHDRRVGSLTRCSRGSHAARPAHRRVGRADPQPARSTRCSTACRARPTTGSCGCCVGSGRAGAARRSRDRAAHGRGARASSRCSRTDRSRLCSAGSGPRTTTRPRDRCPTACTARSPARSRRATRRRRSPPPPSSPAVRPRPVWFALAALGGEQPRVHADAPHLRHRRRRRARRRAGRDRPARSSPRLTRPWCDSAPVGYGR